MPQIPVYNPSQRIEPSAPAAAVSTEAPRRQYDDAFAEGMFTFGNMLDNALNKVKSRERRLAVALHAEKVQEFAQDKLAEQAAKGVDKNDPSGVTTVKSYRESVKEYANELKSEFSPEYAKELDINSVKVSNDYAPQVYTDYVANREKNMPVLRQQLTGTYLSKIVKNPGETNYSENLTKGINSIIDDPGIPDSRKELEILNFKKSAVESKILGRLDLSKSTIDIATGLKQFSEAENIARNEYRALSTSEEFESQMNRINNMRRDYINNANAIEAHNEKMQEKAEKEAADYFTKYAFNGLKAAGNVDFKIDAFKENLQRDPRWFNLNPTQQKQILGMDFSKALDDQYTNKFMYELTAGKKTPNQLIEQLRKDSLYTPSAKVSAAQASKLYDEAEQQKDASKAIDPTVSSYISKVEAEIEQRYSIAQYDPRNNELKYVVGEAAKARTAEFRERIARAAAQSGAKNISVATVNAYREEMLGQRIKYKRNIDPVLPLSIEGNKKILIETERKLRDPKTSAKDKAKLMQTYRDTLDNARTVKERQTESIKATPKYKETQKPQGNNPYGDY